MKMPLRPRDSSLGFIFALTITLLSCAACQTVGGPPVTKKSDTESATRAESGITAEAHAFPKARGLERSEILLGAFSGLEFVGRKDGRMMFITHTDRGPNLDPRADTSGALTIRPFVIPSFQPVLIQFSFDPAAKKIVFDSEISLRYQGRPLSGLPNRSGTGFDETPVDPEGRELTYDLYGADLEGLVQDGDGTFWMADEYRPSVMHFSRTGDLLSRWVPKGLPRSMGQPRLPEAYSKRQLNRGFEGIALFKNDLFAFLQSAMKGEKTARILRLDKRSGRTIAEYRYAFDETPAGLLVIDKIGDAVALNAREALIVEQNSGTGALGHHRVYKVEWPEHATDEPLKKELIVDLVAAGVDSMEKIEGLTIIDAKTLALVNDNDFDAAGEGTTSNLIVIHLERPLELERP